MQEKFIMKCVRFFIKKCDFFITKCDSYYKNRFLSQNVSVNRVILMCHNQRHVQNHAIRLRWGILQKFPQNHPS